MRKRSRERMEQIMKFVNDYTVIHMHSPSVQTIADEMNVSKSTAYYYLQDMDALGMIRYDGKNILTAKTAKTEPVLAETAVLGSVSCGTPLLEEEYVESYVTLPVALFGDGPFFILHANGDSMTGAGIEDGDLVVIRQQEYAEEGQIVVALTDDGSTTLKRFFPDPKSGCIRLHPENPAMKDILVKNCRIQGVAVKIIKSL